MDSIVPLVPIALDKMRYLRLDIAAMCNAEMDMGALWGKEMSIYGALLENPIRLNNLCIIVLHGLRHADPTLSLPEVKGMLNHANIADVIGAVTEAWTKANRVVEPATEGDAASDPPRTVSTGVSSGPSPTSNLDSSGSSSGA